MEKKKTDLKEILSFLLILAGSAILAINMNTFVEQGGLVPGGFSGLSKLIQRVALTFFGLKIPFTLLNVFFNAIPAMLAYRFVGKKFTILSCISIVVVSVLVDRASRNSHHRRYPADLRIRRHHQRPGNEPDPQQQCQQRRHRLHCHDLIRKI